MRQKERLKEEQRWRWRCKEEVFGRSRGGAHVRRKKDAHIKEAQQKQVG